ncbi:Mor transcription activator family protein [Vibrio scophthalmi]|uniref:Putative phage transcription regulator n=1 Tax=Vibrio scophthalmi LMG 19158 TaxID=870967 RepID=F9RLR2_9VIBR|nr:Mor transcription activator family protein [Vibrio scophthalmi]EGU38820.1 putative phage transcription regulator [Vibrio scophthalmi LMG 19158]
MNNQISLISDDDIDAAFLDHADKLPEVTKLWPQDAQALFVHMKANFEKDHDEQKATELSLRALLEMSEYGGGMQFYLPKKDTLFIALRDIQIWSLFNGRNVRELSKRFGITQARIYFILGEQRKIEHQRNQPRLF